MSNFEIKQVIDNGNRTATVKVRAFVKEGQISEIINENESYLRDMGFSGWNTGDGFIRFYFDGTLFLNNTRDTVKQARAMINFFEEAAE